MKNQIVRLLNLSLIPNSSEVREATAGLNNLAKQFGYCMIAMEIADDQTQPLPIRQGALVQFKISAKRFWDAKQFQISKEQKTAILGALIQAFVRCSNNYSLLKLYKQIICIIIGFVHKQWMPTEVLCLNLNSNQNPIAILHIILAIESNFEMTIGCAEREPFYQFLKNILPILLNYVQKNSNEQVIYMMMKILWKAVHYEISKEIRNMVCEWMDLVTSIAGASNKVLQSKLQQFQQKGTVEFYYFHAKKWATKVLYKFICRHASPTGNFLSTQESKEQNKLFSKKWYQRFGQRVIDIITKQFLVPSIKKTRYFQIKCLTELVNFQPEIMKQFGQYFQYQILPQYLKLQPEDEQIANNNPIEFMNKEDGFSCVSTDLKNPAMEAWLAFSGIGSSKKKKEKPSKVGDFFNSNLKYLKQKLEGNNPLQKEMAMYIICQLRIATQNCQQVKAILPNLISNCVVPWFTSDIMFLRARAMQIFDQYGDLGFDKSVIKKAVQGIYLCLTQDNYPLVRLKAASAFHILLQHKQAREQVKPLFKEILQIYLLLIEKYDSQILVMSLSGIIEHFSVEVGPYACELMKHVCRHFIKLISKDKLKQKDQDYDGQAQLAASGVLNMICTLLSSSIDKQNIAKMQTDILDLCDYAFCTIDFIDEVIDVLRIFTHRVNVISQRLLFYYVILIYYLIGIDKTFWASIPSLNLPQSNKKVLQAVRSSSNPQNLCLTMYVLRNYIAQGLPLLLRLNDPFGVNLLQLLFKIVDIVYQNEPNQFCQEAQRNSCSILMIYLLENNHKKWDEQIINHIWMVAQHNLVKAKSKILKTINAQLVCLLLWNSSQKIIALAQAANLIEPMITCIINSQLKISMEHQRQRLILGISELMVLPHKPQQLMIKLPCLFKYYVTLVKKNCEIRLQQKQNELSGSIESEDEEQSISLNDLSDDEIQDIWIEDYQNNYSSKLDEIDEIKYFKQCIQKLQVQQFSLYSQLIATRPADELTILDSNIMKAIALTNP